MFQGDQGLRIDSEFPGGNIVIEGMEGDTIRLHQELRDTEGPWFYWSFRVQGSAGRTLKFQFTESKAIGVNGPAVSLDNGQNWEWLGPNSAKENTFSYAFPADANDVRLAFGIPYQYSQLQSFLQTHLKNKLLRQEELCHTRKNRLIQRLHLGCLEQTPTYRVLITCRHHCCEAMASWVLEGLMEAILDPIHNETRTLGQNAELMIVPFMDIDGVEDGDQGKNRRPHDHNRDYGNESIHESVKALRALTPEWSRGLLNIAIDLHCPHISGRYNEMIYMVGSAQESIWQEQCKFATTLEQAASGPLPYQASSSLPHGKEWNTNINYGTKKSFNRWAAELPQTFLATTFEIPYANVGKETMSTSKARQFGHDLALALARYGASSL